MLNPDKKIAQSEGIDRPVMYIYLAGKIFGNCIDKCLAWRKQIIDHYANFKEIPTDQYEVCKYCAGYGSINKIICKNCGGGGTVSVKETVAYPVAFLDALNSKEADSIDELGLTSALPPKLIYSKDMLSVKKADALIVNMDDMMEEGIKDILNIQKHNYFLNRNLNEDLTKEELLERLNEVQDNFLTLVDKIENRRSNWGTTIELGWGLWLQKPVIIIAGSEKAKGMLEKHPFMRESSVIVESVEELLEKKWVQILYKSLSSTIY